MFVYSRSPCLTPNTFFQPDYDLNSFSCDGVSLAASCCDCNWFKQVWGGTNSRCQMKIVSHVCAPWGRMFGLSQVWPHEDVIVSHSGPSGRGRKLKCAMHINCQGIGLGSWWWSSWWWWAWWSWSWWSWWWSWWGKFCNAYKQGEHWIGQEELGELDRCIHLIREASSHKIGQLFRPFSENLQDILEDYAALLLVKTYLIESALYENYANIYGNSNGILQNIMIWDSANSWIWP